MKNFRQSSGHALLILGTHVIWFSQLTASVLVILRFLPVGKGTPAETLLFFHKALIDKKFYSELNNNK